MREITKYLLIIMAFFYSCNLHKEVEYKRMRLNGDIVINKTTYDKSGNLLTEEILNTDSVKDGYYKMWNMGKLSCIGNYTAGKKDGRWFYLDLLGDTVKIENWFSGKKFGEQSEYYSRTKASGKPLIYNFSFTNLEGKELFRASFNTDGKLISANGLPLYCAFNSSNIRVDSSYQLLCFFGVPKQMPFNFIITETDLNNKKILSKKEYNNYNLTELQETNFAKKYSVEKKYTKAGNYNWKANLQIKNMNGQLLINDSCLIDVHVY